MDNRLQKLHSLEDIWSFHCQIPQGMRPPQGEIQGSQIHRISKRALKVQMGRRPVMREGLLVTREVESSPWYVGDCVRSTQDSSSCQTRTQGDLGEMHPTEMFLLPEDTFWSLEKCPRLVHPAQASSPTRGGTESPEVQRPLAGHPPGPKGNTGPRLQSCGSRGAAAGSETRSRVRHQPQVPREQTHEVEDDGGFVAPRRVLEPGKKTRGAEAGISSRETPVGPSPAEPPLQPSRPEPRLPARST